MSEQPEYGEILMRAWIFAWNEKVLWIPGFFAGLFFLVGAIVSVSFFALHQPFFWIQNISQELSFPMYGRWISWLPLVFLSLFFLTLLGRVVLIFALYRAWKKQLFIFKVLAQEATQHFVRVYCSEGLWLLALLLLFLSFFLPALYLLPPSPFLLQYLLLSGFGFLFLLIGGMMLVRRYSFYYFVLSSIIFREAATQSFLLIVRRFSENVTMMLLMIFLRGVFLLLLSSLVFLAVFVSHTPAIEQKIPESWESSFFIIVVFSFCMVLSGWFTVFIEASWALFFFRMAGPEDTEQNWRKNQDVAKNNVVIGLDGV